MSKKSASGATVLGLLFLVGLVGWVLSLIWLYLLIGGAIALVGWLGWTLARTLRSSTASPHLVEAHTPRLAPVPQEQYQALLPVDPKAFDEPAQAEAAALKVFAAWTQQFPMAPPDPSSVVRSLELKVRCIGRLVSEVAERTATTRSVPSSASTKVTKPKVALDALDPWTMSAEALKSASYHVASCERCAGEGKSPCVTCNGTTRAPCTECKGAGKAYGYTANGAYRLLNCKGCRGKGDLKCTACTKGKAACSTCNETGRCEQWLEVTETVRYDVQVEPDGEMTRAFLWGTDGTPATRAEVEADAKIITELTTEGPLSHDEVARRVPADWLELNWQKLLPKLQPGERPKRQTFWLLEVPIIELAYALKGQQPSVISLEGRRMLTPPSSLDRQFSERAVTLRRARYALIAMALLVPIGYLLRDSYFWNGWLAGLTLSVAGVAVALYFFLRDVTLGRQDARRWALAAVASSVLMCGMAIGAEPSLRAAKRYIGSGQLEFAKQELQALGSRAEPEYAQARADFRLAELRQSKDVLTIASAVSQLPAGSPQRTAAERHLFETASRTVLQRLGEGKPDGAERALSEAAPTFKESADSKSYGAQLDELRAQIQDWTYGHCKTEECRWKAATQAAKLTMTPARQERVQAVRTQQVEALAFAERPEEPALLHLQRLRLLSARAKATEESAADEEVAAKAKKAAAWASAERGKTALYGADWETVAELLGVPAAAQAPISRAMVSDVAVYWQMRGARCGGLYLVGDSKEARVLNRGARARVTSQLLSQAFGHEVALPEPPSTNGGRSQALSKRSEGGVPIVARWHGSDLMELRIGDATP